MQGTKMYKYGTPVFDGVSAAYNTIYDLNIAYLIRHLWSPLLKDTDSSIAV